MSKIKNGRLDRYGAKPFKQQQFGTAGIEGVNHTLHQQMHTTRLTDSSLSEDDTDVVVFRRGSWIEFALLIKHITTTP